MVLENMSRTCIVTSVSEHLRFYGRGTNFRKLGKVNVVYSKIRAMVMEDVAENLFQFFKTG